MRLVYTPDDGEKREFEFKPNRFLSVEAEAIEAVGGDMWDSFERYSQLLLRGNVKALRATFWILRKRTGEPTLKFSDINVYVDELMLDFDDEEIERIRLAMLESEELDPEQKAYLEQQIEESRRGKDQPGSEPPNKRTASLNGETDSSGQ